MSAGNVVLDLRTARALADAIRHDDALANHWYPLQVEVQRAIRALTPLRRWRNSEDDHWSYRLWPKARGSQRYRAAAIVGPTYWQVCDPAGDVVAHGPETGAEGRRKADRALSRWLKRRGVEWTGVDRG